MAVAAAEQHTFQEHQIHDLESLFALPSFGAVAMPEQSEDILVRERAEGFIRTCQEAGRLALSRAEVEAVNTPIGSLLEALKLAHEDSNPEARELVAMNVRTDVIERTIKTGHVMKVELSQDSYGKLQQHRQTMEAVQANSLIHAATRPEMRERVEAETVNAFRIQEAYDAGKLEDHSVVVFSLAPDNLSSHEMEDEGFFTETMSFAIQVTTATGGQPTTESAFVSGVKEPNGPRHDKQMVVALAKKLGVDLEGLSTTEILSTPLLVPNHLIKNGAIDLVEMCDESEGTFFGEDRPREDYQDYHKECVKREERLEPTVQKIVDELVADAPRLTTKVEATERLNKLSGQHMVIVAGADESINPLVFGREAAEHIVTARQQTARGDYMAASVSLSMAQAVEMSNSCPGGAKGSKSTQEEMAGEQDEYGSLSFTCSNGHTNHRTRGNLLSACQFSGCTAKVTC